uniref:Paralemmin-1 n=1 Tax=Equus caballus TaxID=9796 RepID=A0A9L0RAR7_HORSE
RAAQRAGPGTRGPRPSCDTGRRAGAGWEPPGRGDGRCRQRLPRGLLAPAQLAARCGPGADGGTAGLQEGGEGRPPGKVTPPPPGAGTKGRVSGRPGEVTAWIPDVHSAAERPGSRSPRHARLEETGGVRLGFPSRVSVSPPVDRKAGIPLLEKEIEALENADTAPATAREPAAAPSPAQEEEKAEVVVNSQQSPVGTPKEKRVSTPARTAAGATMMKAVVHAVDGTAMNGIHPLSSSEVDELIHKADEVTLSEAGSAAGSAETQGAPEEAVWTTPSRREITGVQAQPGEATSGPPGIQPGQEPPVTMIFMGYQNVEDEAETQKVLGLQDTITAELVVIEDAAEPKEPAPPNGSAAEPPAAAAPREENQVGAEAPASEPQDLDMKKHRCKCCSIM